MGHHTWRMLADGESAQRRLGQKRRFPDEEGGEVEEVYKRSATSRGLAPSRQVWPADKSERCLYPSLLIKIIFFAVIKIKILAI